jgi:hypothetical protein
MEPNNLGLDWECKIKGGIAEKQLQAIKVFRGG